MPAAHTEQYQVGVQAVEAMPGVGVVAWLGLLVADVVHYLVLALPRHLVREGGGKVCRGSNREGGGGGGGAMGYLLSLSKAQIPSTRNKNRI